MQVTIEANWGLKEEWSTDETLNLAGLEARVDNRGDHVRWTVRDESSFGYSMLEEGTEREVGDAKDCAEEAILSILALRGVLV